MNYDKPLLVSALISLVFLLSIGTLTFKHIEGWSTLDAFYFTGMTMLTVGYGDIAPKTPLGKIVSVLFGFLSVGIALYAVNLIARLAFRQNLESVRWLIKRKAN